jgi:hypothetical protein
MRQALLTAALVVGTGAALVTPSLFATSAFADSFFASANSLPTAHLAAQVNQAVAPSGTAPATGANTWQQQPPRPMMMPQGDTEGNGMMGGGDMKGMKKPMPQLSPAEIVKLLVAANIIPQEKSQEAIEVLRKAMLANMGDTNARACFNFGRQLRVGERGEDVRQLKTLLQKEGFTLSGDSDEFTEEVSSAVTGLQEKYKDDILAPAGLKYGTGVVGKGTLAKLNKLQSCAETMQNSASPNGSTNMTEVMKKKMEMEQKYREMCKEGKCPAGTFAPLPPKPPVSGPVPTVPTTDVTSPAATQPAP